MPLTKILSSHLSFVVSPKSRLRTTTLFRLQRGKDEKRTISIRFLRWFYGKRVDGLIFPLAEGKSPLVKLVADEQFPFLILGKSTSPFIPLVDNDNVQAGFDATSISSKGCKTNCLYRGYKATLRNTDRLTGYGRHSNNTDFRLIPT